MTDAQRDALTHDTIRAELKKHGCVKLLSFDEFALQARL
jgi:hypothetical protein